MAEQEISSKNVTLGMIHGVAAIECFDILHIEALIGVGTRDQQRRISRNREVNAPLVWRITTSRFKVVEVCDSAFSVCYGSLRGSMAMVVAVTCIRSGQEGHVSLTSAAPTYCTIPGTIRLCPPFPEPFKNTQMNHSSCH